MLWTIFVILLVLWLLGFCWVLAHDAGPGDEIAQVPPLPQRLMVRLLAGLAFLVLLVVVVERRLWGYGCRLYGHVFQVLRAGGHRLCAFWYYDITDCGLYGWRHVPIRQRVSSFL